MSVAGSHIAKAVGRKINKIQNIGKRDSSCWYEWYHQMLSVTMTTVQFVILALRLFQTKPSKRFNLIKTRVVFFFVRKQNRKQSGSRKTAVFCVSFEKKVLIKSSVHKEWCIVIINSSVKNHHSRCHHYHHRGRYHQKSKRVKIMWNNWNMSCNVSNQCNQMLWMLFDFTGLFHDDHGRCVFFHYAFYFLWINVAWGQLKCRLDKLDSLNALECFAINY